MDGERQISGRLEQIRAKSKWRDLFEGQLQHLGIVILMVVGACSLLERPDHSTAIMWLDAVDWAIISITLAVIHQAIVAAVFRLQLHKNMMTRLLGANDMKVWAMIFMPLLVVRPLSLIMVGWADTVPISGYRSAEMLFGAGLLVLAVWAMHSTLVHFTLPRALGGDHFRNDIAAMPLVNKGVFKYTNNGMYGVAFLGLWGIAFLFGSWNALVVAMFQHAYIWVHMYCTEGPDMRRIYSNAPELAPDEDTN